METGEQDQDPAATKAIRDALETANAIAERHHLAQPRAPERSSTRAADVARSPSLGHEVWDITLDQISTALDHLIAWRDLIGIGRQPAFAHLTLVRGAMESALTATWLLSGQSPDERIARAITVLHHDYEERRKAEKAIGIGTWRLPGKSAAARKAELELDRIRDGFASYQWPGQTKLFALHGDPSGDAGEAIYRIVSAYAHGRRWRLLLGPWTLVGPSPTGGNIVRTTANDKMAVDFTSKAVAWTARAMDLAEKYTSEKATRPVGPRGAVP